MIHHRPSPLYFLWNSKTTLSKNLLKQNLIKSLPLRKYLEISDLEKNKPKRNFCLLPEALKILKIKNQKTSKDIN